MQTLRAIGAWFLKHKERIGLVAIGHTTKRIEEYLFDWLLYGVVVTYTTATWGTLWGSLYGFLIMAPLSAVVCYAYLLFYDWAKRDWFGFEFLKETRDEMEHGGWFARTMQRIAKWGDVPAFFALSAYGDPFLVVVYLRKGAHMYTGLSRRDWALFFGAVLFSNAYWTLRWTVIIELVRYLLSYFGLFGF